MAPIPQVQPEQIVAAMEIFDKEHRNTARWLQWPTGADKHAISHEGKFYPPKFIISLATGASVKDFGGGPQTNGYLTKLGFEIVPIARVTQATSEAQANQES